MKYTILFIALFGLFLNFAEVSAEELGLNVIPASAASAGREALVVTFTQPEDTQIQLYEVIIPATDQASCFAATDFSNAIPLPPERTAQTYGEGKKVVIAFVKTERYSQCHAIIGRSDSSALDFNLIRSNFGPQRLTDTDDAGSGHILAGPKFSLSRHFD